MNFTMDVCGIAREVENSESTAIGSKKIMRQHGVLVGKMENMVEPISFHPSLKRMLKQATAMQDESEATMDTRSNLRWPQQGQTCELNSKGESELLGSLLVLGDNGMGWTIDDSSRAIEDSSRSCPSSNDKALHKATPEIKRRELISRMMLGGPPSPRRLRAKVNSPPRSRLGEVMVTKPPIMFSRSNSSDSTMDSSGMELMSLDSGITSSLHSKYSCGDATTIQEEPKKKERIQDMLTTAKNLKKRERDLRQKQKQILRDLEKMVITASSCKVKENV